MSSTKEQKGFTLLVGKLCLQNGLDFVQFQLSKLSKLHLFSPPCSASGQSLRFCGSHPFKSKLFEFRKLSFVFLHLAAQSPGRLRLRKCIFGFEFFCTFYFFPFWLRIPTFLTRGRRCVVADLLSSAGVITALSSWQHRSAENQRCSCFDEKS